MQNDVGVHYKPVSLLRVQLGMLRKTFGRQDRSEPREVDAKLASLEATRYIIPYVSLPED
jgi:hypothetical protein